MAGTQSGVRTRVETRSEGTPRARVLLTDATGMAEHVDVTGALVAAIAHSLWQARGGEAIANWADAESALDQLVGARPAPAQSEVKPSAPARVPTPTGAPTPTPAGASAGLRRPMPRR